MPTSSSCIDIRCVPGLDGLVDDATRAGEVLLTRGGIPVARIVPLRGSEARRRRPGSARGLIHMAHDFDAMPEELDPFF
jgi:antitoxin (DNA-binding transcriptional repressor) of toxin-antitoxin stability system